MTAHEDPFANLAKAGMLSDGEFGEDTPVRAGFAKVLEGDGELDGVSIQPNPWF
jgi:hypothetical protein